jgi:hypothetical protein
MASATSPVLSCVLLRANAAVPELTTPLPYLPRVPLALPGTLFALPCFSTGIGMISGRALSTLPRGSVSVVAAAQAPLGVSATVLGVSAPPFARRHHRSFVCKVARRARNPHWWDLDTPKVFCHPGTNFRYRREPPSNFHVCPTSGSPPQVGHRAI